MASEQDLKEDLAFPNADVDVYLYGVNDEKARREKVEALFGEVSQVQHAKSGYPSSFSEGPFTYACHAVSPYRPVQIIRRKYDTIEEILSSFDINCCEVAYQGPTEGHPFGQLWVTERAFWAIKTRTNIVEISSNRSMSYEDRLVKYSKRGFAVSVLKNDEQWREYPDDLLRQCPPDQTSGLVRLLVHQVLQHENVEVAATELRTRVVPYPKFEAAALTKLTQMQPGEVAGYGSNMRNKLRFADDIEELLEGQTFNWARTSSGRPHCRGYSRMHPSPRCIDRSD